MARPRVIDFIVEGSGQFPTDMLRYDECWPIDSISANNMAADWGAGKRIVHLRTINPNGPNAQRWESFTWKVIL